MQVAGKGYCFDEKGEIMKNIEGCKVRFNYHIKTTTDKNHLHFILF